jgi:molybdopterin/thiamine biosynthesis adenylyltransferase
MALTDRQIERYSRQIIVPEFGGVAQERLLAARILLIANHADADSALAYLVGAGIGQIDVRTDLDDASGAAIVARMRDLNPDSTVRIHPRITSEPDELVPSDKLGELDLALALASDDPTLDQVRALCDWSANSTVKLAPNFAITLARLDQPARIAVIPRCPPCPRCASVGDLLAPIDTCADNAGFVAMLATLEAIKLLARFGPAARPTLIEFGGYECSSRSIDSLPGSSCSCLAAPLA